VLSFLTTSYLEILMTTLPLFGDCPRNSPCEPKNLRADSGLVPILVEVAMKKFRRGDRHAGQYVKEAINNRVVTLQQLGLDDISYAKLQQVAARVAIDKVMMGLESGSCIDGMQELLWEAGWSEHQLARKYPDQIQVLEARRASQTAERRKEQARALPSTRDDWAL